MDRETAITRALGAFWAEIETIYPRTFYQGISADAFNHLREAAAAAVAERLDEPSAHGSYCSCRDCREASDQARLEAGHTVSDTEPPAGCAPVGPLRA